jgi:AraC-like DNA-binding protein
MLGIFSIFENIKGNQFLSFFKINLLFALLFISTGAFLLFLEEIGFDSRQFLNFSRLLGNIALVNVFYIVANNKISKSVLLIECIIIGIYFIMFYYGFNFLSVKGGVLNATFDRFQQFHLLVSNPLLFTFMIYNVVKIFKNTDPQNIYQVKIRNWTFFLLVLIIVIVVLSVINFVLHKYKVFSLHADTRILYISIYLILLLFVLFRPKFMDESDFSYSLKRLSPAKMGINVLDFEFLFSSNHYFLQSNASLDDFALKLNHTKTEVLAFLKSQTNDSFIELLNRNRIKYFKELLKSNKQESFTIEALSEMAGFNTRQSMYNAFKKLEGSSPSGYISNL